MTDRAHCYRIIEDNAGNPLANVRVSVLSSLGGPFTAPLYTSNSGGVTLTNPFTTPTGEVEFYLDLPARVILSFRAPGAASDDQAVVDVEVPHTIETQGDLLVTNSPAAGTLLQASSPTTAQWVTVAAATGTDNDTVITAGAASRAVEFIPDPAATAPTTGLILHDTAGARWLVTVDTTGHLTTTAL